MLGLHDQQVAMRVAGSMDRRSKKYLAMIAVDQ